MPLLHAIPLIALVLVGTACSGGAAGAESEPRADSTADATDAVVLRDVDRQSTGRLVDLLVDRFPSLRVTPGGVRLRGAVGPPLYVVDGVPLSSYPAGLAPQDVATIRLLRRASETAPWGVQGGNGVVVVTTRERSERPRATRHANIRTPRRASSSGRRGL